MVKKFIYTYEPKYMKVVSGILEESRKQRVEEMIQQRIKEEYKGKEQYNAMTSLEIVAL